MNVTMAIILSISAFLLAFVSVQSFREKIILFNNAYIYATKEQRKKMNKKPYYHQSGTVFAMLAVFCAIDATYIY